jgi:hypothetical protein
MKELMESPLESKSIMINTGLKKEPFLPDVDLMVIGNPLLDISVKDAQFLEKYLKCFLGFQKSCE